MTTRPLNSTTSFDKAIEIAKRMGMKEEGEFGTYQIPPFSFAPKKIEHLSQLNLRSMQIKQVPVAVVIFNWTHKYDKGTGATTTVTERRTVLSLWELRDMEKVMEEFRDAELISIKISTLNPDFVYLSRPNYFEKDDSILNTRRYHLSQAYSAQKEELFPQHYRGYPSDSEDYAYTTEDIVDDNGEVDVIGKVEVYEDQGITLVVPYGSYVTTDIRD